LPEPLVWHIALENMTDQERFKSLNWGLLTWDHWYWNDLDYRFGDDWGKKEERGTSVILCFSLKFSASCR
jgi:hypothetical protein